MTTTADTQILTAHYDDKTVASLLFDFFAVDGDASLDGYLEDRARPLLDGGAATAANIFELREQEVPATPLARGTNQGLTEAYEDRLWHQLDRGAVGTAVPDRPRPAAVYGAAYQLAGDDFDPLAAMPEAAGRSVISTGAYRKMIDFGRPDPTSDDAFQAAMIVFTHPTDLGYTGSFDDWYTTNHMIDVAKSPPFRSATRYILERRLEGTPLPYLCIYEVEAPYSERMHRDMMQQVGVDPWPQREAQPVTDGGQGVLMIDFWGYFQRAWHAS